MKRLVLVLALASFLVVPGLNEAAHASSTCTFTGTATSTQGLLLSPSKTVSFYANGTISCSGSPLKGSGGIHTVNGKLTGTCSSLKGSAALAGKWSGNITISTVGPAVSIKGTLAGHPFNAVGVFTPQTGDCVTKPLTKASVTLAGTSG